MDGQAKLARQYAKRDLRVSIPLDENGRHCPPPPRLLSLSRALDHCIVPGFCSLVVRHTSQSSLCLSLRDEWNLAWWSVGLYPILLSCRLISIESPLSFRGDRNRVPQVGASSAYLETLSQIRTAAEGAAAGNTGYSREDRSQVRLGVLA